MTILILLTKVTMRETCGYILLSTTFNSNVSIHSTFLLLMLIRSSIIKMTLYSYQVWNILIEWSIVSIRNKFIILYSVDYWPPEDDYSAIGFFVDCDSRNLLIRHIQQSQTKSNILFFDFLPCLSWPTINGFHIIEAFRVEVTQC